MTGRIFASLGLAGLGVTHFLFGAFTTGRAPPWPESLPGGSAWAFITGATGILVAVAVLFGVRARLAAIGWAVIIFAWAFLRQLPVVAGDSMLGGSWTLAGKALAFTGGLLALTATSDLESIRNARMQRLINLREPFVAVARSCLAIFFFITGIQHFMYLEFVASLIPPWFPGDAVRWTQIAGIMLLCCGAGLVPRATAPFAAMLSGAMVFSWFWIVHIPRSLGAVSDRIAVHEALLVSGIALVIAGFLLADSRRSDPGARLSGTSLGSGRGIG